MVPLDDQLQQPQEQLQRRRCPPPDGGQDGAQAKGEEPGVPRPGHIKDDGDPRLQEGGALGDVICVQFRRRGRVGGELGGWAGR